MSPWSNSIPADKWLFFPFFWILKQVKQISCCSAFSIATLEFQGLFLPSRGIQLPLSCLLFWISCLLKLPLLKIVMVPEQHLVPFICHCGSFRTVGWNVGLHEALSSQLKYLQRTRLVPLPKPRNPDCTF